MDDGSNSCKWLVLALVCVGTFMSTLDSSIVNVAMPTLTGRLHTNLVTSQWFVLVYNLVVSAVLLTAGRLGDIKGRRRVYAVGAIIFSAGSLFCGLSVSAATLIFARALQATGAAVIMSNGAAFVTEAFPFRERGRSLGFVGTAVALGLLTGPVAGGLIIERATYPSPAESWRWLFLINVPVGGVLACVMWHAVNGFDGIRDGKIDLTGAAFLAVSLSFAVLTLANGGTLGWTSVPVILGVVISLLSAMLFVRAERAADDPVLDLTLFGKPNFSIGAATGWANFFATTPVTVFLPFYLQGVLGLSAQVTGLVLAAGPVTLALVAPFAGALSDRIGSRVLTVIGLATAGSGLLLVRDLGSSVGVGAVVWRVVVVALGSALFVSPNSSAVMGSVLREEYGIASGVLALVRNLGMMSGVATAGAVITSGTGHFSLFGLKMALLLGAVVAFVGAALSAIRTTDTDLERRSMPSYK